MKILVTGAAGFIGMHVAKQLLNRGDTVIAIDNLNNYYDPLLKLARVKKLKQEKNFIFFEADLDDCQTIVDIFAQTNPEKVINLAAQAGVRYSLTNPHAYVQSNLVGFLNVLECCRRFQISHFVYASSSSVYGANNKVPFSVQDRTDHPISLYAATKKANELMAFSYSHLYNIPCTGLRYFTVYGPWGRPDMSPWLFTSAILEGRIIDVYNYGKMQRDFTFVDDAVEATVRALDHVPGSQLDASNKVYNIGNSKPVPLLTFIQTLEELLDREARINFMPMQAGDVESTFADIAELQLDLDFKPATVLRDGLSQWVNWYRDYATSLE